MKYLVLNYENHFLGNTHCKLVTKMALELRIVIASKLLGSCMQWDLCNNLFTFPTNNITEDSLVRETLTVFILFIWFHIWCISSHSSR